MFSLADLIITNPPQNETVCVRDEVNITCGYSFSGVTLTPVWRIDDQPFSESVLNRTIYGLPIVSNTNNTVLTVYSVHERMNKTTFQCELLRQPPLSSSVGMLTVMGKAKYCIVHLFMEIIYSHRSPNPSSYQGGGKETDLAGNIMGHIQPYLMW